MRSKRHLSLQTFLDPYIDDGAGLSFATYKASCMIVPQARSSLEDHNWGLALLLKIKFL